MFKNFTAMYISEFDLNYKSQRMAKKKEKQVCSVTFDLFLRVYLFDTLE